MELDYFYPLIGVLACLLGVYFSFRYFIYYRGRIDSGEGNQDISRRLLRRAQVALLVTSLALVGSLVNLYDKAGTITPLPAATTPTSGEGGDLSMPGSGLPASTPNPLQPTVPTQPPESSSTPEVIPGTGYARIGNTNGFGANVRSEPGLKYEMLTQLSDGSRVELTGEVQSVDGFKWQRVRLEDGRLGWIAENFLIPEP